MMGKTKLAKELVAGCDLNNPKQTDVGQCQINKENIDIEYNNIVQQGDNVVPILFLFPMLAVSETQKKK
jgi:hypothetical protein